MVWDHEVAGSNPATPTIRAARLHAEGYEKAPGNRSGRIVMGRFILYSLAFIGFMAVVAMGIGATAVTILWLQDRQWQMNAARNRQTQDERREQ